MNKTKKARAVPKGTAPLLLLRVADELKKLSRAGRDLVNLFVHPIKHTHPGDSSQSIGAIVALLANAHPKGIALLDVRNAKLHAFDTADAALLPLLEGEALSFCRMFEGA